MRAHMEQVVLRHLESGAVKFVLAFLCLVGPPGLLTLGVYAMGDWLWNRKTKSLTYERRDSNV